MSWLNLFTRSTAMAKDPVCGMNVDPDKTKFMVQTGGKSYYFCARACMEAFNANPAKYLAGGVSGMAASSSTDQSHQGHGDMGGRKHGCC